MRQKEVEEKAKKVEGSNPKVGLQSSGSGGKIREALEHKKVKH